MMKAGCCGRFLACKPGYIATPPSWRPAGLDLLYNRSRTRTPRFNLPLGRWHQCAKPGLLRQKETLHVIIRPRLDVRVQGITDANNYRECHLADDDRDFYYRIDPGAHSSGCYEIELVIEKIAPPGWQLT